MRLRNYGDVAGLEEEASPRRQRGETIPVSPPLQSTTDRSEESSEEARDRQKAKEKLEREYAKLLLEERAIGQKGEAKPEGIPAMWNPEFEKTDPQDG